MNLHSKFCYCYITWTCICIIHQSEGALLLYYMYILYFTPTWRYLAIVLLYCIGLYTYLRGSCFYTILYYIVQDTYLRGPCYCPGDWRRRQALPFSPAVQTVLLHPLSKYEIKIKYTSYMYGRFIFNYIQTTNIWHTSEQRDKFYPWVRHT